MTPVRIAACLPALVAAWPLQVATGQELPQSTPDGLELTFNGALQLSYRRRGVNFDEYSRAIIEPIEVTYSKEWEKDHRKLKGRKRERVGEVVAESLHFRLSKELQERGVVSTATAPRPDVMRVTIAIADLYVTTPQGIGSSTYFSIGTVRTSGTLVVEVRDSVSDTLIARFADRARADRDLYAERVLEDDVREDTDWVIERWIDGVREELTKAKRASP